MTKPVKKKEKAKVLQADKDRPWYRGYLKRLNTARRTEYRANSKVRETKIEKSRQAYRDKVGLVLTDCRENLGRLAEIGTVRLVHGRGARALLTFTLPELAEALMVSPLSIYRWKKSGIFPAPYFRMHYAPRTCVYVEKEVRLYLKILGPHQTKVAQYGSRHTDVQLALFAAAEKARLAMKGEKG